MNTTPGSVRAKTSSPEFFSTQVAQARRFYLNLKPPTRTSLAVVCGGYERCAPDYRVQREDFPYYSIEFVARGKGRVRLGKRKYSLGQGSVFAYGPGIMQEISTDPTDALVKFFVDFTGTRALELLRLGALKPGEVTRVFAPGEVEAVFEDLIRNGQRATRHSAAICARLLEYLALKIAESQAPPEGQESQAVATYLRCRQYIVRHFLRLRTLEQIARECHVNAAHLCRLFRRCDHQSPYQLLLRLKINHAAELLREPNMLVKQAAEQVGFADPFHFSRVFKSTLGVSPEVFRRLR